MTKDGKCGLSHFVAAGRRRCVTWLLLTACLASGPGCFKISIQPSCPDEIAPGAMGELAANEVDPGAIPVYLWEAFPPTAVEIVEPTQPTTTFEALTTGQVVFRLTASDGLFQVVNTCHTQIVASLPTVLLTAAPQSLPQGESTLLTCTSTGAVPAVSFAIDQLDGPFAELTAVVPGTSVGVFNEAGDVTFRCIGTDATGRRSAPALVTVSVTRPTRPGGGGVR